VLLVFRCFPPLTHTNHGAGKDKEINPGWHVFLYNLTADRAETTDLWAVQRDEAKAMLGRFIQWQVCIAAPHSPATHVLRAERCEESSRARVSTSCVLLGRMAAAGQLTH
jgi:hypothetical protein